MKKLPEGWYPVQGGPHDGQEYYPPNEPKAGRPVFLGLARNKDGSRTTQYVWNSGCTAVVFGTHVHLEQ